MWQVDTAESRHRAAGVYRQSFWQQRWLESMPVCLLPSTTGDLVFCDQPYHVPTNSFLAVMPAVIGAGPRDTRLRRCASRRRSLVWQRVRVERAIRRAKVSRSPKVQLVELTAKSAPFMPYDDVKEFWVDPSAQHTRAVSALLR
jgi:hypothetical protein